MSSLAGCLSVMGIVISLCLPLKKFDIQISSFLSFFFGVTSTYRNTSTIGGHPSTLVTGVQRPLSKKAQDKTRKKDLSVQSVNPMQQFTVGGKSTGKSEKFISIGNNVNFSLIS